MSYQRLPDSYYYNNGTYPPTPQSGQFSEHGYTDQDWSTPSAAGPSSHYHPNIDFWEGYDDDGSAPQQSFCPITSPNMVHEQVTGNQGYNHSAFPTAPPLTTYSNNNTVSTPGVNWNYETDGQVVHHAVNPQAYSAPSFGYMPPPGQQPITTPVSSVNNYPIPLPCEVPDLPDQDFPQTEEDIDETDAPDDATETAWRKGRWCEFITYQE
jgi:hypothetical protein